MDCNCLGINWASGPKFLIEARQHWLSLDLRCNTYGNELSFESGPDAGQTNVGLDVNEVVGPGLLFTLSSSFGRKS